MNQNQPAFPVADTVANGERYEPLNTGLTKLEYFAGLAMQGIIAHKFDEDGEYCEGTVADAIEYAKELLKQLEENK